MKPLRVIEPEVVPQALFGLPHCLVGLQGHFLVLHRAPELLDEDVVKDPAATVVTEQDAGTPQSFGDRAVLAGANSCLT